MKFAILAPALSVTLLAGCATWTGGDPGSAKSHAARNATVVGELQALNAHARVAPALARDGARLTDGRRTWSFAEDGTYRVVNADQTQAYAGTWSYQDGVFCRSVSSGSGRACGVLYRIGPVYRVTRSATSDKFEPWSLTLVRD